MILFFYPLYDDNIMKAHFFYKMKYYLVGHFVIIVLGQIAGYKNLGLFHHNLNYNFLIFKRT